MKRKDIDDLNLQEGDIVRVKYKKFEQYPNGMDIIGYVNSNVGDCLSLSNYDPFRGVEVSDAHAEFICNLGIEKILECEILRKR